MIDWKLEPGGYGVGLFYGDSDPYGCGNGVPMTRELPGGGYLQPTESMLELHRMAVVMETMSRPRLMSWRERRGRK